MNRLLLLILISISFPLLVFKNTFAQSSLKDTLVINELLEIADSIMINTPKEAKLLVDSAMVIANYLDIENFKAKCLRRRIDAYYYLGKYSKTVDNLFELLSYYENQKDTAQIVSCYNDIGTTYAELSKLDLSLEYLYKAIKMVKYNDTEHFEATVVGNIGYTYFYMKNYEDAYKYFNKSLKLCAEIGYKEGIATTNSNIGKALINEEKYDSALVHFQKALTIYIDIDQQDGVAMVYNYLGIIKYRSKKYDEAIKLFIKSADIRERMEYFNGYMLAINNIAFIYNLRGKKEEALRYYEKALSKANDEDDKGSMIILLTNINKQYATMGNYTKAYEALQKCSSIKDDVYNIEKSEQIEELKIEFETEQKEAEIKNLKDITAIQNESLQRRQMIIFLLVGTLILIALILYFGITRYRLKTEQQALKLEQQALKLEQRLLRSQMNPHFIFNSLSVIQGYIFKGSTKEAAGYLSSFAKLMRHILENSREEFVPLEKEIETLEHYLELQNIRNEGKIDYSIIVSDEIDKENISVPPMIAQPFIENSIKHGFKEDGKIVININYFLQNRNLFLAIEDDGIGINKSKDTSKTKSENHNSLAISITESRLQLLNKNKKEKFNLKITDISEENSNKTGTQIEIEIPYLEEF